MNTERTSEAGGISGRPQRAGQPPPVIRRYTDGTDAPSGRTTPPPPPPPRVYRTAPAAPTRTARPMMRPIRSLGALAGGKGGRKDFVYGGLVTTGSLWEDYGTRRSLCGSCVTTGRLRQLKQLGRCRRLPWTAMPACGGGQLTAAEGAVFRAVHMPGWKLPRRAALRRAAQRRAAPGRAAPRRAGPRRAAHCAHAPSRPAECCRGTRSPRPPSAAVAGCRHGPAARALATGRPCRRVGVPTRPNRAQHEPAVAPLQL